MVFRLYAVLRGLGVLMVVAALGAGFFLSFKPVEVTVHAGTGDRWKYSVLKSGSVEYVYDRQSDIYRYNGKEFEFLKPGQAVIDVSTSKLIAMGISLPVKYRYVFDVKGEAVAVSVPHNYIADVLKHTNEYRTREGLAPLKLSDELNSYAKLRAKEISIFFSHSRKDGSKFYDGLNTSGYKCYGENIGLGAPTAKAVVDAWYESPGHRRIMMHPGMRELGVGCLYDAEVKTEFSSVDKENYSLDDVDVKPRNARIYWVQEFRG